MNPIELLFDTSGFPPRWTCGQWTPLHGWIHIVCDLLIFGAYFTIPAILVWFLRKRKDVPFSAVFWLFGLFILSCGAGHLVDATLFWFPWYRFSAFGKIIIALASWGTVLALIPVVPAALRLPGLKTVNEQLAREIEVREGVEAKLLQRNRDLEMLLHITSHDLRTPLRAIENFSSLIEEIPLPDNAGNYFQRIRQGASRMDLLLDDITELSRARQLESSDAGTPGEKVVAAALERLAWHPEQDPGSVKIITPLPEIHANVAWAVTAVANLLSNARKFSGDAPPDVEIRGYRTNGLVIADRGPGVPEGQAETIFQMFHRGVGRTIKGTGAGLAIVRTIAERHGGAAWMQPRAGGGSEFFLSFESEHADRKQH
ncbi:MAG: sensor histidine kinase [Nannocystaceae bacterium]